MSSSAVTISAGVGAPWPISLMPSSTITHFTPGWLSTSRSKRASALAPVTSRRTRLPPIPMFHGDVGRRLLCRQPGRQQRGPTVIGVRGGAVRRR